jgi:aminoglycoside phosphotransferase family enzyme
LNNRLTENVYIGVLPVYEFEGSFKIGGHEGTITDYAVRMNKLDRDKQMDNLLLQHKVTKPDIQGLAEKIASFHKKTAVIYKKDFLDIKDKFNDLGSETAFLSTALGADSSERINHAIAASNTFMEKNKELLAARLAAGFFRDCHGDLHSRNIFLLPEPLPFDCIEFNDDFRQIDVLNEVAFLCMDLDAFNREDLSDLFIEYYNQYFPAMKTKADRNLFIYYKSYRANIRAKVNSLRAKSATDDAEKSKALATTSKYLLLMESYLKSPGLLL